LFQDRHFGQGWSPRGVHRRQMAWRSSACRGQMGDGAPVAETEQASLTLTQSYTFDMVEPPHSKSTHHLRPRVALPPYTAPIPRDSGAHTADRSSPASACRFSAASPPTPALHPISGASDADASEDSLTFPRPVFPSPVAPGWSGDPWAFPLGFSLRLPTPPLPATPVKVGTGSEHWPGTTPSTSVDPPLCEFRPGHHRSSDHGVNGGCR
jgi:hypothetical protein